MRNRMNRRAFVLSSTRLALLAGVVPPLLQACGGDDDGSGGGGGDGSGSSDTLPLARLDRPVTLPDNDLSPVAADAEPEDGTLNVFTYPDYINPASLKAFRRATGTKIEISTFDTEDRLLSGLANEQLSYDVVVGATTLNLPRFVVGNLIQPLNLELLPNFANVLASLKDPYYDKGSKYSVPYTLYTTGVAFRRDIVDETTLDDRNGWDLLWNPDYAGYAGVLDDAREVITLGMYHEGVTETNTADPAVIEAAAKQIDELVAATNPRFDINAYQRIPEGTARVNQAWSGDMLAALQYLPEGVESDVLGYWAPKRTTVANDFMIVPASAERPVRAHQFLDFLLGADDALQNFEWVGYQPALVSPSIDELIDGGYVPEHLRTALVSDEAVTTGYRLDALSPDVQTLWDHTYARIKAD